MGIATMSARIIYSKDNQRGLWLVSGWSVLSGTSWFVMNNDVCSEGTYEVTRKMSERKGSCILDRLVWTSVAGLIKNCQGEVY